jgi:sodium transport system ATP-binding protein
MIITQGVHKKFITGSKKNPNTVEALVDASFVADDGNITALLGPNGAGKTTLLRILAGLEKADDGTIKINGIDSFAARKQFAYLSDGCGLYPRLTAYENIAYFAELYGLSKQSAAASIETLTPHLDLAPLLHRKVAGFSQGQRMRVAIARAMVHDPQTIILDEPTNGLDLLSVRRLRTFLKYLASAQGGNKCILFSTHIMHEVEKLADKVVLIASGSIKTQGNIAEIKALANEQDFEEAFVKLTQLEAI